MTPYQVSASGACDLPRKSAIIRAFSLLAVQRSHWTKGEQPHDGPLDSELSAKNKASTPGNVNSA